MDHPPQKTECPVRVHRVSTRLMYALAIAYRLLRDQGATRTEPVGWQHRGCQPLEQTRELVIEYA